MNRHILLIVKVLLIVAASLCAAFAFLWEFYFLSAALLLLIIMSAMSIITSERRIVRRIKSMMKSIQNDDMSVSFPPDAPGLYGELNRTTNRALSAFRTRIHDSVVSEAEMEAWQKLIRVLGHEMMNSLAPIISLSETMTGRCKGKGNKPDEQDYLLMLQAMESIHRRSKGLLHFVENYRKLTRIPDPIKQFFMIGDLFADIKNLMGDCKAAIRFSVTPPSARLYADRSQIEQVILNVIKNSIEAAGDSDDLEIAVEASGGDESVVITITDNGPGIAPEGLDKVFVPFYTTKQTGSGIGLSLSRQIMKLHKGTIIAESSPDGGAVFTLFFDSRP